MSVIYVTIRIVSVTIITAEISYQRILGIDGWFLRAGIALESFKGSVIMWYYREYVHREFGTWQIR